MPAPFRSARVSARISSLSLVQPLFQPVSAISLRTDMLHFEGMSRTHLHNLRVQNSGFWTIHFQYSSDIVVENMSVFNAAGGNADGIDIDSSRRALVRESSWDVGDDMLCVKSGKNWAAVSLPPHPTASIS